MKHKRDFPAACNAGGCDGECCLPASLAPISPHARGSHQNDKTEAERTEVESTKKKHRTSSHYSEEGKEALGGEKP